MACRVIGRRSARSVAVAGPAEASAARMLRRVGSARAMKTCSAMASMSGGIEVVDQFAQFARPAPGVAVVRLAVGVLRQLGEAALDHGQPRPRTGRFERELDVGAARVVVGEAVDVPGEAEDPRLLDALDADVGRGALLPLHLRRPARAQVDRRPVTEPGAQALGRGQCGPDSGRRPGDLDGPLDAVGECHEGLPMSSNSGVATLSQLKGCHKRRPPLRGVNSDAAAGGPPVRGRRSPRSGSPHPAQSRPPPALPATRWASHTGTTESSTRAAATTLTTGAWLGRNRFPKIHSGRVCTPGAAVNVVTMISSKDRAKASSPPASSADRSSGNVTSRKGCQTPAPRSIEASSSEPPIRRSRASTLLYTSTTQNVACAITIVSRPHGRPRTRKALFSAIPVTTPGSAMGSRTRKDTVSRPKKRYRATAKAAPVPSSSAITVAPSPARTLVSSALRAPSANQAFPHHSTVKPVGGQLKVRDELNELTSTTPSGR